MTTKEETLRRIAIMQAWCDGEKIEIRSRTSNRPWEVMVISPDWTWDVSDYRIAPKPKRKVKLFAWLDEDGILFHVDSESDWPEGTWIRIPSLDLEAEVDD